MSNRRVKSLALDEDEYDDFEDNYDDSDQDGGDDNNDKDLSPEDEEQMRQGTINVRRALGTASSATDTEIRDALWHYYYDVGKSVAYLKSTSSLVTFSPALPRRSLFQTSKSPILRPQRSNPVKQRVSLLFHPV